MLPPASSLSPVDMLFTSKPDELEPSIHRSFQPPRACAVGAPSSDIQEAAAGRSQTPCEGSRSMMAIAMPAARPRSHHPRHPATVPTTPPGTWAGTRSPARCDLTTTPPATITSEPRGAGRRRAATRRRPTRPPPPAATIDQRTLRDPRAEHAVAGAGPRPRCDRADERDRGAGDRDPSPGPAPIGLGRDHQVGIAELLGDAFGAEDAAAHRDGARDAERPVASGAAGRRGARRMVLTPLAPGRLALGGGLACGGRSLARAGRGRRRVVGGRRDSRGPLLGLHADSVRARTGRSARRRAGRGALVAWRGRWGSGSPSWSQGPGRTCRPCSTTPSADR